MTSIKQSREHVTFFTEEKKANKTKQKNPKYFTLPLTRLQRQGLVKFDDALFPMVKMGNYISIEP